MPLNQQPRIDNLTDEQRFHTYRLLCIEDAAKRLVSQRRIDTLTAELQAISNLKAAA